MLDPKYRRFETVIEKRSCLRGVIRAVYHSETLPNEIVYKIIMETHCIKFYEENSLNRTRKLGHSVFMVERNPRLIEQNFRIHEVVRHIWYRTKGEIVAIFSSREDWMVVCKVCLDEGGIRYYDTDGLEKLVTGKESE